MLEGSAVAARTRTLRGLRIGSVIAVGLAAAFVTWLYLHHDSGGAPAKQASAAPTTSILVSVARLRSLVASLSHPVYWASARRGMHYELTQSGTRTYIRYLPANVRAGDPRPAFLSIGTYADPNAFEQTRTAGRRSGAIRLPLGGGGIAVYSRSHPTSVYFAYPGSGVQVEVYDPNARTARRLVLAQQVVPIR
jgi:hypothetical protein